MQMRSVAVSFVLALALAGCAHPRVAPAPPAAAPTLTGDSAHPDQGVSEEQWRAFLDKEVTPRFPAGLSVVDLYGQWQGKNQAAPERLRSRMLIIYLEDNVENRAKIDAIRSAWKQQTGDQSVLRVVGPVDVSF